MAYVSRYVLYGYVAETKDKEIDAKRLWFEAAYI